MGNKGSREFQEDEIEAIRNETGFSPKQILRLYHRFTSLDKGDNGYLTREDFLRVPELAINPLGDRIVHAFFTDGLNVTDEVNFRQFIRVLAKFRPIDKKDRDKPEAINSKSNKILFAFKMYDLDDDTKISREELLAVLHMMVGANISEEQLLNIADRTLQEADSDRDGMITFEEFCQAIERTDVEQKMSIRFLH